MQFALLLSALAGLAFAVNDDGNYPAAQSAEPAKLPAEPPSKVLRSEPACCSPNLADPASCVRNNPGRV